MTPAPAVIESALLYSNIYICIEDWADGVAFEERDRIWYTLFSSSIHRLPSRISRAGQTKTNKILFLVSLTFCVSWFPFCVFCIVTELLEVFHTPETLMTIFMICHLLGMFSTCTNPT